MNRAAIRLAVTRTLKVYRGEGARLFAFVVLHALISLVIGMTSTVVDALTVGRTEGGAYALYAISATVLAGIGLVYAGITDRSDKRRVLIRALAISALICLGGSGLLFLAAGGDTPRIVLNALFVWRFTVGIVLLMVFWDLTPFYFNARQGKRLFPLLAMAGAVGYSVGSLVAAGLVRAIPAAVALLVIGGGTLVAAGWFHGVRRTFFILDSPRYRDRSILAELREGAAVFRGNAFLRAVGWNTVLFGVLSGLILFTYNAVVTARTSGASEAAGVMGYQRAAVTILQAVVLTKVMSQSAVGGGTRSSVIQQSVFLVLGVLAFAVSMVGVADFTRQIEVALMSPAAMAAFAFLPGRYRGRVMVLNNMVAAAAGILIATAFVASVAPWVQPLWFVYPIGVLMVVRVAFGAVLNRRYTSLLSESIVADRKLNLARIEENATNFVRDDELLARLRAELAEQSSSVQVFVRGRLARGAVTVEDLRRIEPFFSGDADRSGEMEALWVETVARVAFDEYRERIAAAIDSPDPQVRRAARRAELKALHQRGHADEFARAIEAMGEELNGAIEEQTAEPFADILETVLHVESETGVKVTNIEWDELSPVQQEIFLESLSVYPRDGNFEQLLKLLTDPDRRAGAIAAIAALPAEFLVEHRQGWAETSIDTRQELLHAFQDPVLVREEGVDLLMKLLPTGDEAEEIPTVFLARGETMLDVAMNVMADPSPIPPALAKRIRHTTAALTDLFPDWCRLRFAAEEVPAAARPLVVKTAREYIDRLSVLVLLFQALNLSKEDDRVLAYTVVRELTERATAVQHNTLEFIEAKIRDEARTYLLTYFETMTVAEKRSRLRSVLKRSPGTIGAAVTRWRDALSRVDEPLIAEILGHIAGAAQPSRPS
ncbi:MAG: MFS transporter [Spirochaeta sp.]|jgi:hypothetical protein|nr:MFS transporter [Spirochaeta sp.]